MAHWWQYKQTVFFGPWHCTKGTEFLTTGSAQLAKTRVSDKFLKTYKYSQRGISLLKASSKLPDGYISPPLSLSLYVREKNLQKINKKTKQKKPNLELVRRETRREKVEVGKISLADTSNIVKMGTTGSAIYSTRR